MSQGAKKPGANEPGANHPGGKKPEGEKARRRKNQVANEPGGETAKRQKSQTPTRTHKQRDLITKITSVYTCRGIWKYSETAFFWRKCKKTACVFSNNLNGNYNSQLWRPTPSKSTAKWKPNELHYLLVKSTLPTQKYSAQRVLYRSLKPTILPIYGKCNVPYIPGK